jgi:hypothetical protein
MFYVLIIIFLKNSVKLSLCREDPYGLIVVVIEVGCVGLLKTLSRVSLDKVNFNVLRFSWSHLSPIQDNLRVVISDFIEID